MGRGIIFLDMTDRWADKQKKKKKKKKKIMGGGGPSRGAAPDYWTISPSIKQNKVSLLP